MQILLWVSAVVQHESRHLLYLLWNVQRGRLAKKYFFGEGGSGLFAAGA